MSFMVLVYHVGCIMYCDRVLARIEARGGVLVSWACSGVARDCCGVIESM